MQQTTIDQWIINYINIKKIFYLDWSNNIPKVLWLDNIPNNINFLTKINWRIQNTHITLCGRINQNSYQLPSENYYQNISYLKSHLQKCIRRKLYDKAVKTAFHMIKLDVQDFLRRLPIIMIEDVILHESFPIIIWLMVAVSSKKEFILQEEHIIWLLSVVHTLCIIDNHDKIGLLDKIKDIKQFNKLNNKDNITILYSLQLRAAYGGMKVDIKMLNYFTKKWYNKFKNGEYCNQTPIQYINTLLSNMIKLKKEEWLIEAIDFHCAPYILDMIQKEFPNMSKENIQSTIWHNSSKINVRDNVNIHDTYTFWIIIKERVKYYQQYILDNYV